MDPVTIAAEVAQSPYAFLGLALFGAALGAGLVVIGAGYGISKIASAAVESMARQPEVAGSIQLSTIITAALIEGVSFFAALACFNMVGNVSAWIDTLKSVGAAAGH